MENNVTMVAYSPFAQGLLTGKYRVGASGPAGVRSSTFTDEVRVDKTRDAEEHLLGNLPLAHTYTHVYFSCLRRARTERVADLFLHLHYFGSG